MAIGAIVSTLIDPSDYFNAWYGKGGPQTASMSDAAILEAFNNMIDARDEFAAQFENKVVEVPIGKPQIEYSSDADQWAPRGSVLRCHIEDDEHGELVVHCPSSD